MRETLRDPTCLRPTCRFTPMPTFTDGGELDFFAYCSLSCKEWCEAAVTVAQADYSPVIERRAHRLDVLSTLLDLREQPGELEELTGGTQ